ncbi:MAG TPA: hypothetical protein VK193_11760 [Methyloceanibacter sp.]|jgi:hypothetical protein|nr:hypothetical protein [Methyloceanibacter sp.]
MWLKRILIGVGLVLALAIAMVFAVGYWTPSGQVEQTLSVTVGHRTVTIGGQYKSVTQESMADGMSIKVDGHEITLTGDQLTIDGKTQVLEPDQNIEIWVDEEGKGSVKVAHADAGAAGTTAQ